MKFVQELQKLKENEESKTPSNLRPEYVNAYKQSEQHFAEVYKKLAE